MKSPRRPTMRDVASRVGVSLKTVSRAINNERGVAPATKKAVLDAARAMGYTADLQARSLRRGDRATEMIGVVVSSVANPFSAHVQAAVECEALRNGAVPLALSTWDDADRERLGVATLVQRQVDGLIVAVTGYDQAWLSAAVGHRPVVCVDRIPTPLVGDAFVSDSHGGMREALTHLEEMGHHRIAFIGDSLRIETARSRRTSFEQLTRGMTFDVAPGAVVNARASVEAGKKCTRTVLSACRPTAIIAAQNLLAAGAYRELAARGLTDSVALISFDEIPNADLFDMPVSVVRQDPGKIGSLAARRLFERIRGAADEPASVIRVPTELIVRGSGRVVPQSS